MSERIIITLAQLNQTAGDLQGNTARILEAAGKAAQNSDILLTPELSVCGYPPEDLLLMDSFIRDCGLKLEEIRTASEAWPNLAILVGHPSRREGKLYNCVSVVKGGKILLCYEKKELPNYGVFDEARYFFPGGEQKQVFQIKDTVFGIAVCEDVWFENASKAAKAQGAQILLIPNASPYEEGKLNQRLEKIKNNVTAFGMDAVYVNMAGAQDEIVFDGASFACSQKGVLARLAYFDAALGQVAVENGRVVKGAVEPQPEAVELLYRALVTGFRDYVQKNKFKGIVLGLSGGVDSALVLKIAVDAVGADNTLAVMMPSVYTSSLSRRDALALADRLGVRFETISIQDGYSAFEFMLARQFQGKPKDVTEENLQARIRGVILMAISNKFSSMVATTGNKSEMAVGYSTLYGDLAGGYAVLKDVYKTQVYEICRWLNRAQNVFPETILTRPPTAELRENQKDQDSLPDYGVLDGILKRFIEEREDTHQIVKAGYKHEDVQRVLTMLQRAEYKRRQSPIGPKVTKVAFGRDWRFPVTDKYKL